METIVGIVLHHLCLYSSMLFVRYLDRRSNGAADGVCKFMIKNTSYSRLIEIKPRTQTTTLSPEYIWKRWSFSTWIVPEQFTTKL